MRDIETEGGEVIVARADAADGEQMEAAIGLARSRWGEIEGVIHAFGGHCRKWEVRFLEIAGRCRSPCFPRR